VVVASLLSISASTFAGPNYRLSSKSPVPKAPVASQAFNGYIFGFGGIDFGGAWDTTGAFSPYNPGNCPPTYMGHYGGVPPFDPTAIPIDWDLENGWTAGGGVGRYSGLFGGSRFELEGSYTSNEVGYLSYAGFALPADFEIKTKAVMVNFLKEVPFQHATGYFGAGAGWGWTTMDGDIDTIEYGSTDDGFAWQLIAGIDFPITERLALFTQYRYLVLSEASFTTDFGDFTNTTDDDPASHAILVGARLSF